MPATFDSTSLGEPVAVGQIGRELKKIWDVGEGTLTRASLINFAVYCRSTEALLENTELISEFTRTHACRALVICVVRNAPAPHASAWVNAHCHLSGGTKHICCEQISFLLEGEIKGRFTNIVFSNLDSDLPLYFWWQGDISENLNPHLWAWIDRLIVDSIAWRDPKAQFARLRASLAEAKSQLALRDLNWTRSLALRQAISQIFDHPENLPHLLRLRRVSMLHAPQNRSTALFFIGWLAGQLHWKLKSASPIVFADSDGGEITIELQASNSAGLSRVTLASDDATFALRTEAKSTFFHATFNLPGGHTYHALYPGCADSILNLLDEEMGRANTSAIYLRSLSLIESLL
ncbi:MAG: glucose-6-phosphate dehydrogenase assembly protein OpcA [Chthoniobacter sp.]|nr:glucose-6-phosphate dehydrogenase assembly protein OpcA [Chthoniobacter sp.]